MSRRVGKVVLVDEDGRPFPSFGDVLKAAESPQELYDSLIWALGHYTNASRGTIRKWERRAEKLAASLRIQAPGKTL